MTHPAPGRLALYAGGDLGWFESLRLRAHLRRCGACAGEVAAFAARRDTLASSTEELPPDIGEAEWSRLSAEMHANIRLGLEAGQIVSRGDVFAAPAAPRYAWATLATFASVAAAVGLGVWLQRPVPAPPVAEAAIEDGFEVASATANGIEFKQGKQGIGLLHQGAKDVTVSVSAAGEVGARYVDANTGYVVIQNVGSLQ